MTTPDNEKQPTYQPHTFTEGGGGLCGKCGHAIYNRLHATDKGAEQPAASELTKEREQEICNVLTAIEGLAGTEDEQMLLLDGRLSKRETDMVERLCKIYRLSHGFNEIHSCHHHHADWRAELDRLRTTPQPSEQALQDEIDARDEAVAEIQKLLPDDFLVNAGPYEWFVEAAKAQQAHIRSLEQQLAEECSKGLPQSIQEALNSGDGTYRP